jgi:uncharacterized RDD family membrane protein YckC
VSLCPTCGTEVSDDGAYCPGCGAQAPASGAAVAGWVGPIYAGLWRRGAAQIIDGLVLYLIGAVIGGFLGFLMAFSGATPMQVMIIAGVISTLCGAIYEIGFHASAFQATVGKAALRIKVTDKAGARLSVARATGRYLAKFVSFWTLGVAYVMAGFTRRRQALHDKMAGTLVVRAKPTPEIVAAAPPAATVGPVGIALLVLLGMLPYLMFSIALMPAAWQLMQQSAQVPDQALTPRVSQQELLDGQRVVRAALFGVQSDRARLSERIASGEPLEQISGNLDVDPPGVESIDVLKGAILIVFSDEAPPGLAQEQLALVPALRRDGTVTWLCGYADRPPGATVPIQDYYEYSSVDEAYLPEACRYVH